MPRKKRKKNSWSPWSQSDGCKGILFKINVTKGG